MVYRLVSRGTGGWSRGRDGSKGQLQLQVRLQLEPNVLGDYFNFVYASGE